jgi:hypothetical protein
MQLVLLKHDAHYRKVILVDIQVLYANYKLAHGVNFLVCNEFFAIKKWIVSKVFHEFVVAMNVVSRSNCGQLE